MVSHHDHLFDCADAQIADWGWLMIARKDETDMPVSYCEGAALRVIGSKRTRPSG